MLASVLNDVLASEVVQQGEHPDQDPLERRRTWRRLSSPKVSLPAREREGSTVDNSAAAVQHRCRCALFDADEQLSSFLLSCFQGLKARQSL